MKDEMEEMIERYGKLVLEHKDVILEYDLLDKFAEEVAHYNLLHQLISHLVDNCILAAHFLKESRQELARDIFKEQGWYAALNYIYNQAEKTIEDLARIYSSRPYEDDEACLDKNAGESKKRVGVLLNVINGLFLLDEHDLYSNEALAEIVLDPKESFSKAKEMYSRIAGEILDFLLGTTQDQGNQDRIMSYRRISSGG